MKNITKKFNDIKKVEAYYSRLLNKYSFVRIIGFPRFSEEGNYTFQVR